MNYSWGEGRQRGRTTVQDSKLAFEMGQTVAVRLPSPFSRQKKSWTPFIYRYAVLVQSKAQMINTGSIQYSD